MPEQLMPREKAQTYGIECLSNSELLALIIKSGYSKANVFEIVDDLLNKANGFSNLMSLSYEELISIKGIKDAKALELMAILEISKRLARVDVIKEDTLKSPEKVVEWLRCSLGYKSEEEFFVVFLNNAGAVIKAETMYKGNRTSSIVGIDEIMRRAVLLKATNILVAHNHPSDNVYPSTADIEITSKLSKACSLLGICMLDHIIVGKSKHYSFKDEGLI